MRNNWTLTTVVFLVLLGALATAPHGRADIGVDATLRPQTFSIRDGAQLTITVSGNSRSVEIDLPEVDDIRFHRRGQSSQMNMINGSFSSSIATTYLVEALAPGSFSIPPIEVRVKGDVYTTKPLSFTVTDKPNQQESGKKSSPETGKEIAFLQISPLGNHYPGEIVPIEIKAYFNSTVRVDLNSLPRLVGDGVVMPQLRQKPRQTEETVAGSRYNVLTWDTSLAGIKAGGHQLSFELDATLLVPSNRRSRSLFGGGSLFDSPFMNDPFFDSVFGNYQRKPITVATVPLEFKVVPLPDSGKPTDFGGAIGDFEMTVAADPREVDLGEPITLSVTISGSGNFDRVHAPPFPDLVDWKTYSPSAEFEANADPASGTKTFEQAIVPKNDNITSIPSLSFSYFDPLQEQYITLTSDPIAITIQPAPEPATIPAQALRLQPQLESQTQPPPADDFSGPAPPKLEPGSFSTGIRPVFFSPWYLGLTLTCLAGLVFLLGRHIFLQKIAKNPELIANKQRKKMLANDLAMITEALAKSDNRLFLNRCRTAIQNQLGALWQVEPAAISLADLKTRLEPSSPLVPIFSTAEEAHYGGGQLKQQEMEEFYHTIRTELETLL